MPRWLPIIGILIVVAVAVVLWLLSTADDVRRQWDEQYQDVLKQVQQKRGEVDRALSQSQSEASFQYLTQLHWTSHNLAQMVYEAFNDSRSSLRSVQAAYRTSATAREKLRTERNAADTRGERDQLNAELRRFVESTRALGGNRDALRRQRDTLLQEVRNLNARTRSLKLAIRDSCGRGGQVWYQRLESRTEQRRQLPPG